MLLLMKEKMVLFKYEIYYENDYFLCIGMVKKWKKF